MVEEHSTKEIARHLKDVPASSLYRHLKILLEAGYIIVAETRFVQGIQEKVYRLALSPRLGQADLTDVTHDDHLRYFTIYVMTLLRGFADYLDASPELDFLADNSGYTEAVIWTSPQEFADFTGTINRALVPLLNNQMSNQKTKHKIAIVTHPIRELRQDNE
jgi:DNA-binding transcriptional ArsR family regulator